MEPKKKILWLVFLAKLSITVSKQIEEEPITYEGHKFISVVINNDAQINQVVEFQKTHQDGVEFWDNNYPLKNEVSFIVSKEHATSFENEMKEKNITYNIRHSNLGELIRKERSLPDSGGPKYKFNKHNNYYAIENYLKQITARHWKVAQLFEIGRSFLNRSLYAVKITRQPKAQMKKVIMFECGIHSREWTSVEACIYVMHNFIVPRKGDTESLLISRFFDIIVIPMVNPDGYVHTWEKTRMWRKTRSCYLQKCEGICVGVDANRNFASGFGVGKTSSDPCTPIYRGPTPFSEREAVAVRDVILKFKGRLIGYFSFHSFGPLWLVPYSRTHTRPRNFDEMARVAAIGAAKLAEVAGTKFEVGTAPSILYLSGGTSMDYAYDYGKAQYSYTLELRKGNDVLPFIVPEDQILETCEETLVGVKAAILAFKPRNFIFKDFS